MRSNHSGDGIEPIICTRKSRLSTDYDVVWADESAEVLFGPNDTGKIVVGKDSLDISAGGPLSRKWTCKKGRETVFTAERHGLRSAIEISGGKKPIKLERKHMLGSAFRMVDPDGVVAEFERMKTFSDETKIDVLDVEAEFDLISFAFWLVTSVRRASTGSL